MHQSRSLSVVTILALSALLGACAGDTGRETGDPASGGLTSGDAGSGGTDSSGSTDGSGDSGEPGTTGDSGGDSGGDSDGDSGDDGIKFDTPDGMTGGGDDMGEEGCTKVDFLFVVDNSGSMEDDQVNLINNFPGFMEAIEETLEVEDFHVMVVDTDAGGGTNPECFDWWEQQGDPWHITPCPYDPVPVGAPADMIPLYEVCDRTIGAGVDMPLGLDASNVECSFASGARYIDASEPDPGAAFSCAAKVGTGGNNGEKQAEALITAVSPELTAVGGCNEGFLRNDALLVVTILTDEDDNSSDPAKDPVAWAQALVDAKAGKEENIVILGLLSDWSDSLRETVLSFTYGQVENVKIPDYRPFFEAAVGDIEGACDDFVPPG